MCGIGRGIEIFRNLRDIRNFISEKQARSLWVAQKYVERPLLYYGRKFDIRVWVLVTDRVDVFFYKSGYIRTSSDEYTLDAKETYVHLTNNCLQQWGDNYGKHEEGNTLSFDSLQGYLNEKFGAGTVSVEEQLVPRMKDLIIDTILAVKSDILSQSRHRGCCFELLGYDFLIDEDLRTWLIEVNTNPYLGIPNVYISKLLPKMLSDLLDLVLNPVYPSATSSEASQNDFQLILCEKGSIYSPTALNVRRGYSKDLLYPVKQLRPEPTKNRYPKAPTQPNPVHASTVAEDPASLPPQKLLKRRSHNKSLLKQQKAHFGTASQSDGKNSRCQLFTGEMLHEEGMEAKIRQKCDLESAAKELLKATKEGNCVAFLQRVIAAARLCLSDPVKSPQELIDVFQANHF